jgi:prepilin-type processing-associated H-X9-DG protein
MIVFTDEHANSIDDGFFMPIYPGSTRVWFNVPGSYHNQGNTFSFADGHAENHRWIGAAICVVPLPIADIRGTIPYSSDQQDYTWVINHSTAKYNPANP